jgi:hypothetical protein
MKHTIKPSSFQFQNNQSGVFLTMADYRKMVKILDELKSMPIYHAPKTTDKQLTLTELLNRVATEKERMTLTHQKEVFLVAMPIEDVETIEKLKNCIEKILVKKMANQFIGNKSKNN